MNLDGKRILISRTDSIGDVMLSLPMCAWLKNKFPSSTVLFLGRKYTESIVNAYDRVDQFVDWDSFSPLSKEEKTGLSVDQFYTNMAGLSPMKRIAEPTEVAEAISFLASPRASYINGINVPVDGGRTKSL